ncbi:acyl carrier protein [Paenibacillus tundrae]|uniref:acyl carrier protein n=1 Tax=Paenibacillus tundrae TaxID=528187 RepID=UPI0022A8F69A|nr:acyl carrier protein [Paenibacillus tundrae]MCZ1264749.1 acyl carrier protein [Paenibacillus tundrae]
MSYQPNHCFMDLGVDSVMLAGIVEVINQESKINLALREIMVEYNTIEKISNYIFMNVTDNNTNDISMAQEERKLFINNEVKSDGDSESIQTVLEIIQHQKDTLKRFSINIFDLMRDILPDMGAAHSGAINTSKTPAYSSAYSASPVTEITEQPNSLPS